MENSPTPQTPTKKKFWQSKTIMVNLGFMLLAFVNWVSDYGIIDLAPDTFAAITAFINMYLRFMTKGPLEPIGETLLSSEESS